ncbi:MAG: CDP-diacylglycerol--glycerol-3-phosphate 3-phosphatidyltransferase [Candidatus Ancillula sp.]|jgi:CDP-diacylglycerol--glycerol-3-phosphate 3-phosphatidyltransferase|nr:CDP-diacylglycerol--glycerol-3-phosphate 3-phosphatidyltransferase [Candidatus Ancillula sp.]
MKNNVTIANFLTILRVTLAIPFIYLLFLEKSGNHPYGILGGFGCVVLFGTISLLDVLDGYIARKRYAVTNFGKFLDPLADKLFLSGVLFVLCIFNYKIIPFAVLILLRELFITIYRVVVIRRYKVVIPASRVGKYKTVTQLVSLGFFVAPIELLPPIFTYFAWILLILATILTYISAVQYIMHNVGGNKC